jgi:hypothetical protein
MKLKRTTQNSLIIEYKTDALSQGTQLLAETSLLLGGTKEEGSVQPRYKYTGDGVWREDGLSPRSTAARVTTSTS